MLKKFHLSPGEAELNDWKFKLHTGSTVWHCPQRRNRVQLIQSMKEHHVLERLKCGSNGGMSEYPAIDRPGSRQTHRQKGLPRLFFCAIAHWLHCSVKVLGYDCCGGSGSLIEKVDEAFNMSFCHLLPSNISILRLTSPSLSYNRKWYTLKWSHYRTPQKSLSPGQCFCLQSPILW